MASGASRQTATKIVAGPASAAADQLSPRRVSTTGPRASAVSVMRSDQPLPISPCPSTLERLVPPLLERRIVLGHIGIVEVDQALLLLGREADALLRILRNL